MSRLHRVKLVHKDFRFAMATGANKIRSSILLPREVGNIIHGEARLTEKEMALSEDYLLLRGAPHQIRPTPRTGGST